MYVVVSVVGVIGGDCCGGVGLGQPLLQVITAVEVMVLVWVTGIVMVDVPLVVVE